MSNNRPDLKREGTLPSPEEGEVNRTACLKFLNPCYKQLPIQIKNCGTFFVYHLTPGPDDSGFCFGIEKPEPPRTPGEHTENVPNATLTIQRSSITSNSFIAAINVTSGDDILNVSAELVLANGSVLQSAKVTQPSLDYKWENLSPSTNYTVRLYTFINGEKSVLATSWAVTGPPGERVEKIYNATLTISQGSITPSSFITAINVSADGEMLNVTAEVVLSDGSVLQTIEINMPLLEYKWENLNPSTNYTVRLYTFSNRKKRILATLWTVTKAAYRPASANINLLRADITNHSFTSIITYDHGSENLTGEGTLLLQDGRVIRSFSVDKPSLKKTFQGLNIGTKYIVVVHTSQHGQRTELDRQWVFTQPGIEAYLQPVPTGNAKLSSTAFRCMFHTSPEVAYSVRWMVQRDERNYTIVKTGEEKHENYSLSLTEEDLVKNHISLPFHISCAIAGNQDTTPKTSFSVSSNNLFAGITILTPHVTMHRDETAVIRFTPTVPYGCYNSQNANNDCKLTLAITVPVSKNCTGISTRKCTISISGDEGIEHDLQIQATEDGQYGMLEKTTYKVILRTANLKNDTFWNGYVLPAVTVIVKPEIETYWRGKRCEALNDPHMYTFDGVHYEHHESFSDEYVLYTHTSYRAKVHHKLERCNSNAMCNCGIAVQAGRDIYVISTCNNIMEIGYKQCDDGVLLVRQETDSTYTIYLPYGTYVKARLDKSPYFNSVGSMIVSVSLYPSVHDQHGRSKGLCGSLDNNRTNDFHDRTGHINFNRTEFIQTWRVSKEESLFNLSAKSTASWVHPACTCSVSSGQVTTKEKCHLGADNTCAKGRTVGEQTCKLAEKISVESTEKHTVPVLDLSKDGNHKDGVTTTKGPEVTNTKPTTKKEAQVSQTTTSNPSKHWNHNKAKTFCTTYMNSSRAFRLCARVPHTDTERAIETCTQDIVITQTTEWHRLSRQSMQDSCISEIHRNKTVREDLERPRQTISTTTTPSGQPIGQVTTPHPTDEFKDSNLNIIEIVDAIEEIACPNECSDHGTCKNGTCKCYVGFGGDDCSIDFKKPPSTSSLLHGSTCDEKEAKCTHVFIYGGFFASESVTCHITTFETHANKEGRLNMDAYTIRGQAQSLIEVICSLVSPIRRKRSLPDTQEVKLMSCYRVSVSNDGIHHGTPLEMCVYNSECQTFSNSSSGMLTANIKKEYCFIDGLCVPNRKQKPSTEMYCLPEISLYSWSALPTSTQTSITTTTSVLVTYLVNSKSNWQTPVIVAVVCICTICVIVSLVVCIRKRKRRKTEDKKKQKGELKVNFKHDADFDEETYAYINPTDVSDNVPYEKTSKRTTAVTDDYLRLDKSKQEKTQYAKLNARNNRGGGDGPVLPERPNDNVRDPYEKLRSTNQKQGVYDKIQNEYRYRHTDTNGMHSDPYTRLSNETHMGNESFQLEGIQEDYLIPTEVNDERNKEPPRKLFIVRKREEDIPEGYERPDPQLYKQY
ncbi:uncharacterized protein LOC123563039 [Mercenaria mercenaria]|uniref:uncharacterized protein LOC123563039 n=1 Tax=Mercenaria mercenaria TaxID=6596 RepID=UPI00234ECC2A|nr:uncharacterized protein LOC123563039 [Mercenaria mercenaria]